MLETVTPLRHVGIILDGNRRWAKAQGIPYLEGHRKGAEVFKEIALHTFDKGIKYLSAYIFSKENYTRPEEEVSYLMRLVVKAVEKYLDEFNKRGIKILIIGSRDRLNQTVKSAIEKTEEKTANNSKGVLTLCFNYGGRQEIVDATKKIVEAGVSPESITEELIEQNLYAAEVPDIDLLVRTSGEERLSGFMLWRAAYAELKFVDKLWPDVTTNDFDSCFEEYKTRQRRFGR